MKAYRILLDPQGGEGGTAPTPTSTATTAATTVPAPKGDDGAEGWKALLAKSNNDAIPVVKELYADNHKLRGKLRDLRGKAVPDGATVLSADDAKAWNEYRALGKVEDLKAAKEGYPELQRKFEGIERQKLHDRAAAAHGLKAPVLSRLLNDETLQVEVKTEPVDGKPAQVAYVRHKDDQGKDVETKLPDYARAHWPDFLPALSAEPDKTPLGTPPRRDHGGAPPRTDPDARDTPAVNLIRAF